MLVAALTPLGDMITVLSHHGSTATAFSVHGLTAALVALTGFLLLREHRTATAALTAAASVSPATVR